MDLWRNSISLHLEESNCQRDSQDYFDKVFRCMINVCVWLELPCISNRNIPIFIHFRNKNHKRNVQTQYFIRNGNQANLVEF